VIVRQEILSVGLGQTDWRDLLVAAGFAENTRAHKGWKG
jgi:hypothetical protein